ncbi:MAG TPA: hypothetical protein VJ875_26290, partial [Pyrinomonadaceae bacterium]|nr:hypothetical protein [Pyrinomonadaceae bacterium]
SNAESVRQLANSFRVSSLGSGYPRFSLALEPWAEISQRLRRYLSFGVICLGVICFGANCITT